ncbi:MAG: TetR/AcrR family transcriptional regulator [Betaproteobacteria bacterium]|nr:TetR/AcrR family transcriptional regulator [Betaproteobacteria bacterium]
MRYAPEHRVQTRERIVREAAAEIRKHGPDRIGVASLMSKAGLTHGGFYAHFKSKDDLVAEAITYMFDDRYAAFLQRMQDVEPAQGLAAYVDGYLTVRHRDQPQNGCPLPCLTGDLARMSAAACKRFDEGTRRLTNSIADALRAMERPCPEVLAASMLSEMVGAMAIARAVSDNERSKQILLASRDSIKARIGLDI